MADETQTFCSEQACAKLMMKFYYAFDRSRYDEMEQMFTRDGVWHRAGKTLSRRSMLDELVKRSPQEVVHHVVTNVAVDLIDADSASIVCYVKAYRGQMPESPSTVVSGRPFLLVMVQASLVKEELGWKFSEKKTTRLMEF